MSAVKKIKMEVSVLPHPLLLRIEESEINALETVPAAIEVLLKHVKVQEPTMLIPAGRELTLLAYDADFSQYIKCTDMESFKESNRLQISVGEAPKKAFTVVGQEKVATDAEDAQAVETVAGFKVLCRVEILEPLPTSLTECNVAILRAYKQALNIKEPVIPMFHDIFALEKEFNEFFKVSSVEELLETDSLQVICKKPPAAPKPVAASNTVASPSAAPAAAAAENTSSYTPNNNNAPEGGADDNTLKRKRQQIEDICKRPNDGDEDKGERPCLRISRNLPPYTVFHLVTLVMELRDQKLCPGNRGVPLNDLEREMEHEGAKNRSKLRDLIDLAVDDKKLYQSYHRTHTNPHQCVQLHDDYNPTFDVYGLIRAIDSERWVPMERVNTQWDRINGPKNANLRRRVILKAESEGIVHLNKAAKDSVR